MSVFSSIAPEHWIASNRSAFAVLDKFPVTEGHALVISRREIPTWWDASVDEQADLMALVAEVRALLDDQFSPAGYNVGFNAGSAAGQTVDHLHLHVIPRRVGDMADPRGGIRNVIPERGNYLATAESPAAVTIAGSDQLPPPLPDHLMVPVALDPSFASGMAGPETDVRLIDSIGDRRLRHELIRCLRSDAFDRIDLLISFIMRSGLRIIRDRLDEALDRGAAVRVLTTDYLQVTDSDALAELLDLSESHRAGATPDSAGGLQVRVFSDPLTSFHPKAYLFRSSMDHRAEGFVGSSNLSLSGIDGGVEWSLGVTHVAPLVQSFDGLWEDRRSTPLDHEFLRTYRNRRLPSTQLGTREIDIEIEAPAEPVAPTEIQVEALDALEASRAAGHRAGLVVMATGLGKTWLAAFDSTRTAPSAVEPLPHDVANTASGRNGRVLFIAHREEILNQSRDVYRRVAPSLELGLFHGTEKQPDADVVFASIQTISRRLDEFAPDAFDYVVVDEFHHAAASSYRRVIDHFRPRFLLGLTATPQRMDGADLMALCGDNLVFECGLIEGIDRSALVPFHYWGISDVVDYEPIPWRNGKFEPQALTLAVETRDRAQQTLDEWHARCGERTLAFCASITHADFMVEFFTTAGIGAVAVHSGPTSSSRTDAVQHLRDGTIEVVFAVDVFNEGVDIPEIDSVMMLRPTNSAVIFLQQLGRGLRLSPDKDHLNVVDFVGNHASFLLKPRTLLSMVSETTPSNQQVMRAMERGEFELPAGCSVNFDLALIDLLGVLARGRPSTSDALEAFCTDTADDTGSRPTAVQAHISGFDPTGAQKRHGNWFAMLTSLGLLGDEEQRVVAEHGDLLRAIETEPISKSYKLVTLRALIADGTLRTGTTVQEVADRSHRLVVSDPRLTVDVRSKAIPEPAEVDRAAWATFWRKNPLDHLAKPKADGPALFTLTGDRFDPAFQITAELGETLDRMVAEIVDWRLASYLLDGRSADATEDEVDDSGDTEPLVAEVDRLDQNRFDGVSRFVGERFRRDHVPEMFDPKFKRTNWGTGHVSLGRDVVLFVTLKKSTDMGLAAEYTDHFQSESEFVWSSQNSTSPEGKKGREVLGCPQNGVRIHLFVRSKKSDVAFEYCGLVEPESHHGEKPMSVTFRLLTPLAADSARRFLLHQ